MEKQYICGECKGQVSDKQKFCDHCGTELGSVLPFSRTLGDAESLGEVIGEEEDVALDLDDIYNTLVGELGQEDVEAFFGSLSDFKDLVVEATKSEEESTTLSEAEAVEALLQMFYSYLEDPEAFIEDIEDSVSVNKRARYVVDTLMKAGVSRGQAMALVAYHGSLKNIRSMRDAKQLLKFKYLRDMLTEKEALRVIDYFRGKRTQVSKIAGFSDSVKKEEGKMVCGECGEEVEEGDVYCWNCGTELGEGVEDSGGRKQGVSDAVKHPVLLKNLDTIMFYINSVRPRGAKLYTKNNSTDEVVVEMLKKAVEVFKGTSTGDELADILKQVE